MRSKEYRNGRVRPGSAIVGESRALREVLRQAEQVAVTGSTVLILGETGTGKELVAREIHELSPRRDRAMRKVHCATLAESGLGLASLFEDADGSTIFLDEIGDLSMEGQAELLRALDDGGHDVRIVAATYRDLGRAVRDGVFREDLWDLLNVCPIVLPPLRERPEDVPLLVWAFVRQLGESMGKTVESIPDQALAALERRRWPGNVRELRNVVERAMVFASSSTLSFQVPTGSKWARPPATRRSAQLADQALPRRGYSREARNANVSSGSGRRV